MNLTEIIRDLIKQSQEQTKKYINSYPEGLPKPYVGILTYNMSKDSVSYVASKGRAFDDNSIRYDLLENFYPQSKFDLEKYTQVIPQLPFLDTDLELNDVLKLLNPWQDVDRLKSGWLFQSSEDSLPVTAVGLKRILDRLQEREKKTLKILFIGNGLTTNRNLYLQMFKEGYRIKQANSKTSKHGRDLEDMIDWADVILSATGCPESLSCENKIIISPTAVKTINGTWVSDLHRQCRELNETHPVLNHIGKLTVALLVERIWKETVEDKIND